MYLYNICKIIQQNLHFIKIINRAIKGRNIALAISGGADSLALFYLIKNYLDEYNFQANITFLIVNHNIRPETKFEIEFVKFVADFYQINCIILDWIIEEQNSIKNFHDAARKARYQLMTQWCLQNNYSSLLTAHHANDQLETFLMRVKRGAGIEGLSSIKPINKIGGIEILRPLLFITKKEIIHYLSCNNLVWIEDRANYNEIYERSIVRKISNNLEEDLIRGVSQTTLKMHNTVEALNYYINQDFKKYVKLKENQAYLCCSIFSRPKETILRILKKIFIIIGKKLESRILYNDLTLIYENIKSLKTNLYFYNCFIYYEKNSFIFRIEYAPKNYKKIKVVQDKEVNFY